MSAEPSLRLLVDSVGLKLDRVLEESGRVVVKDVSKLPPFTLLIGREMTEVRALVDEFNVQFGVRLVFGDSSLLLYNWCDELYASQTPPDHPEWAHVREQWVLPGST